MNPWTLYDSLISAVPEDDTVAECVNGESWTFIRTAKGRMGLNAWQPGVAFDPATVIGKNLREAASLIKSWRYREASVGGAAINTAFNRAEDFITEGEQDAFLRYRERLVGKKVACVGHFAYLEQRLAGLCDLYILERNPKGGDYPDPAAEYLLPEMDTVFITGSTLANKTMPRLLELCEKPFTVISGPSTPMNPILFDYGVDALCGFCVTDEERIREVLITNRKVFASGKMVCLERN